GVRKRGTDVVFDNSLKALHDDRCKCNGPKVIRMGSYRDHRNGDNSGGPEEGRHNTQAQRKVKDGSKHLGELVTLSTSPGMLSGPGALRGLTFLNTRLCSHVYVECSVLTIHLWSGDGCVVVLIKPSIEDVKLILKR
ncbi:hypothetical protein GOODEAATRI_025122, partial [Goodea atripinnis]